MLCSNANKDKFHEIEGDIIAIDSKSPAYITLNYLLFKNEISDQSKYNMLLTQIDKVLGSIERNKYYASEVYFINCKQALVKNLNDFLDLVYFNNQNN